MKVYIDHLPRDSALRRAQLGEYAGWGENEYLLARAVDALNVLVWQPTKDGHDGRNLPEPVWRPGTPVSSPKKATKKRTPAELKAHFESVRARARKKTGGD